MKFRVEISGSRVSGDFRRVFLDGRYLAEFPADECLAKAVEHLVEWRDAMPEDEIELIDGSRWRVELLWQFLLPPDPVCVDIDRERVDGTFRYSLDGVTLSEGDEFGAMREAFEAMKDKGACGGEFVTIRQDGGVVRRAPLDILISEFRRGDS
jgi:hypothetical protein